MGTISREKLLLTAALIVGILLYGKFYSTDTDSKKPQDDVVAEVASAEPSEPTKTKTNQAQNSEQQRAGILPGDLPQLNEAKPDTLKPEMQKFAYECFNGWYFNNPKEDVKSMGTMLKGFFKNNRISKNVAEKEIIFVDDQGVQRKLKQEQVGFDDEGRPKIAVKLYRDSMNGQAEEQLPYELQNLDWNDVSTRMLGGKKPIRERTLMEVKNDEFSRHALVEYVNGERSSVHLEIAGKKLSCAQDQFSQDVKCDCQKEF